MIFDLLPWSDTSKITTAVGNKSGFNWPWGTNQDQDRGWLAIKTEVGWRTNRDHAGGNQDQLVMTLDLSSPWDSKSKITT